MSAAGALGLVAILALSGCGASEVQKPVVIQPVSPAPTPTATDATPPPPPPPTAASASASGGGGSRRQPRVKQGEPQPRPEDRVVPLYGCPPPPDGEFV